MMRRLVTSFFLLAAALYRVEAQDHFNASSSSSSNQTEIVGNETTTNTSDFHHHRFGHSHRGCGTHDPSDVEFMTMGVEVAQWESNNSLWLNETSLVSNSSNATDAFTRRRYLAVTSKSYIIPVFMNVLALSETEGTMTDNSLRQIVKAMNKAYTGTSFQFVLQGIQRRTGLMWHNCTVNNQNEWKAPLYVRGSNALNIYYCNPTYITSNAVIQSQGFSSWPTNALNELDGIVLPHPMYTPGTAQYTIHESGHFMGLLHTYAGGCKPTERVFEGMVISDGDGVQDTPAHISQTLDVTEGLKTCWQNMTVDTCDEAKNPGIDPGTDPVTNYMNFIKPLCWSRFGEFTPGQAVRMLAIYEQFRLGSPWRCKNPGLTCKESFECCGGSCVKATGQTVGKCSSVVAPCRKVNVACTATSQCCSGLACNAGLCRATGGIGKGTTAPVPAPIADCISILCRSHPVKRKPRVRARFRRY